MKKWIPVVVFKAEPISCVQHDSIKTQHTRRAGCFHHINEILSFSDLFIYLWRSSINHTQHPDPWIIQLTRLALWFCISKRRVIERKRKKRREEYLSININNKSNLLTMMIGCYWITCIRAEDERLFLSLLLKADSFMKLVGYPTKAEKICKLKRKWRLTKFMRVNFEITNAYGNTVLHMLRAQKCDWTFNCCVFSLVPPPLIVYAHRTDCAVDFRRGTLRKFKQIQLANNNGKLKPQSTTLVLSLISWWKQKRKINNNILTLIKIFVTHFTS